MSASLVGSEMCIRDRAPLAPQPDIRPPVGSGGARAQDCGVPGGFGSYHQQSAGAPGGVRWKARGGRDFP
eukprot:3358251-Alexandrium_andersonii.AAC.1